MGGHPGNGFTQEVHLGSVGHPGRLGDDDLLPQALEGGEDQGLASRPRHHLVRRHLHVVDPAVVCRDGLSQLRNSRRRQVAPFLHVPAEGIGDLGMDRKAGFSERQMEHVLPGRPHLLDAVVDGEGGGDFETPDARSCESDGLVAFDHDRGSLTEWGGGAGCSPEGRRMGRKAWNGQGSGGITLPAEGSEPASTVPSCAQEHCVGGICGYLPRP